MIVIFLPIVVAMLYRNIKTMPQKDRFRVWLTVCIYLLAMAYYTNYINNQPTSFGYGIPQADMLAHFRGAEALSQGYSWEDLSLVATRFEDVGINTLGYFFYTTFLSLCIFVLPIFDVGTNVYLVYVFQIILSVDACVRFDRFYRKCMPEQKKHTAFYILVCCVPFVVQACQLMRDIYYMWMIAVLLEFVQKHYGAKGFASSEKHIVFRDSKHNLLQTKTIYSVVLLLLMALCVCLRFYSAIVFLPPVLYYSGKKKLGATISILVSVVLVAGIGILNALREMIGIPWEFTAPDMNESIQFFMFPSIVNQSKYLLNWYYYFGNTIDISGCNVPGVYYAMSVWNIWIIPLAALGMITAFRKHKAEIIMWGTILLNIVMVYSVTYDAIDTRHKFFMVLPLCFLALRGSLWVKKKSALLYLAYNGLVILLVVFILLFSW